MAQCRPETQAPSEVPPIVCLYAASAFPSFARSLPLSAVTLVNLNCSRHNDLYYFNRIK
jgi:hypothetical protein